MNTWTLRVVLGLLVLTGLLGTLAHSTQAANPARGLTLWNSPGASGVNMCSDCHGITPSQNVSRIWNASGGPADQGFPSAIRNAMNIQRDMFEFVDWSDADLADLASYINAVRYGKSITAPALSDEECLFNWAEAQLPTVFRAPAVQQGSVSTLNYRLYSVDSNTNALGHNTADSQVWVLAPSFGFPMPVPLDATTSAGLFNTSRAAGCR